MTTILTVPGMFGWPSLLNPYLSGEFTATGTLPAYLGGEFDPVTHVQGVSYRNWLPRRAELRHAEPGQGAACMTALPRHGRHQSQKLEQS